MCRRDSRHRGGGLRGGSAAARDEGASGQARQYEEALRDGHAGPPLGSGTRWVHPSSVGRGLVPRREDASQITAGAVRARALQKKERPAQAGHMNSTKATAMPKIPPMSTSMGE